MKTTGKSDKPGSTGPLPALRFAAFGSLHRTTIAVAPLCLAFGTADLMSTPSPTTATQPFAMTGPHSAAAREGSVQGASLAEMRFDCARSSAPPRGVLGVSSTVDPVNLLGGLANKTHSSVFPSSSSSCNSIPWSTAPGSVKYSSPPASWATRTVGKRSFFLCFERSSANCLPITSGSSQCTMRPMAPCAFAFFDTSPISMPSCADATQPNTPTAPLNFPPSRPGSVQGADNTPKRRDTLHS
mmetsp:Transcript_4657/g.13014  ORF Transcript_4657/g.13014 Transcript_4657/m.13014 type:complete len:242 (-) Transcript_4657:172-897(-)